MLRADRTAVLQEMLPPQHVSITQPCLGPRVPREHSTRRAPGGRSAVPGLPRAAVRAGDMQRAPRVSMHRGTAQLPAPGASGTATNPWPLLPAGSDAPRLALVRFLGGASTWKNHLQATWGETTSAKASFRSRQRKERAGRGSKLEPGAESYSPQAGARQRSWQSREGAIHKPPTRSGRAGQGAGPNRDRDGSRGP